MDKTAKFWNKHAEGYSKRAIADISSYQHKLNITQSYFHANTKVLEIGCGTGSTAILHAPHVKHILATDISPNMLAIAQSKAQTEGIENVTFQQSPVEKLSIPEPVDAVLALSLLHLLENKEGILDQVCKWLKPGGIFVTSTACLGDKMKFFKFIGPIGKFLGLIPFVEVMTANQLKQSLTDAGFEIDYEWQPDKGVAVFIIAKRPL